MMRRFVADRGFLLRYYAWSTFISLLALAGLYEWHPYAFRPGVGLWILSLFPLVFPSFLGVCLAGISAISLALIYYGDPLTAWHLALIPMGIYAGMLNVAVVHNCAHENFRPRWMNRVLGELCSFHLMSGFPGFAILHLLHHRHADDPVLDPHPNGDCTYWQYLNGLKASLGRSFQRFYVDHWGDNPASRLRWRTIRALLSTNRVIRALLVLFLFGPLGFAFFYVPSILANQLTYAHINYYTHIHHRDGRIEIVDLNSTPGYRLLNALMMGIYCHATHHRHAYLLNPAKYPGDRLARA